MSQLLDSHGETIFKTLGLHEATLQAQKDVLDGVSLDVKEIKKYGLLLLTLDFGINATEVVPKMTSFLHPIPSWIATIITNFHL